MRTLKLLNNVEQLKVFLDAVLCNPDNIYRVHQEAIDKHVSDGLFSLEIEYHNELEDQAFNIEVDLNLNGNNTDIVFTLSSEYKVATLQYEPQYLSNAVLFDKLLSVYKQYK